MDRICRRGSGYLLQVDSGELDLLTFREENREGHEAAERGDFTSAAARLAAALARWQGNLLAGLSLGRVLAARRAAIEAERLAATERLAELHLRLGEHDRAVSALSRHVQQYPLRERAHSLLIRALYQAGDAAAALAAFTAARKALVAELGVEPGPELQRLHRAVLNRDGSVLVSGRPGQPSATASRPRELPADVGRFVGRQSEKTRLISLLERTSPPDSGRPAIAVLCGGGGVGKSTLGIHVAHRVSRSYPDGLLYIDLQGSSDHGIHRVQRTPRRRSRVHPGGLIHAPRMPGPRGQPVWHRSAWVIGMSGGRGAHRVYSVVVFIVLASLDNVAIGLVPPLYDPIATDLGVSKASIGLVTAVGFLVTAVAAVGWAYYGDRSNRKRLLMIGTLLWAAGTGGTALVESYLAFFAAQMVAAAGLGAVASVGFSVVSDLVSPRRRGLVMSFWGLSQGVGTLTGVALGGLLGASDWRRPFIVLTAVGVAATIAYFFTYDIRRGQSEPELARLFEAGGEYEHRISRADLPGILHRRTNVWLVLQGLSAQVVFGSFVWLPQLFQAKAESQGYDQRTAIVIGSVFAVLFQLGGVLSIIGGLVGDRVQRRNPGGRALVAAIGILAAVPLYVVLFFVPLPVDVPAGASTGGIVAAVFGSVVTEPTVTVTLLVALVALALTSANSPNWFALISDVNPPEHRGTVYSLGNLANGGGRFAGNWLVGVAFEVLAGRFAAPMNYAVGLAAFQVFFLPTGIMYWLASRTSPRDIAEVRQTLHERAAAPNPSAPVVDGKVQPVDDQAKR